MKIISSSHQMVVEVLCRAKMAETICSSFSFSVAPNLWVLLIWLNSTIQCEYVLRLFSLYTLDNIEEQRLKWLPDNEIISFSPSYFHTKMTSDRLTGGLTDSSLSKSAWLSQSIDCQWPLSWTLILNDSSQCIYTYAAHERDQLVYCTAPAERSGSEHDLTAWLDDIPTSPGVRLPPKQGHKTQHRLFPIQRPYKQQGKKHPERKQSVHRVVRSLCVILKGLLFETIYFAFIKSGRLTCHFWFCD